MINTYVTFGQIHVHNINGIIFDKDTIALIVDKDAESGRAKAFEYFGDKFFTTYNTEPDMNYFPKGVVEIK